MSPFLGAAVADEIVHGRRRLELADFQLRLHPTAGLATLATEPMT